MKIDNKHTGAPIQWRRAAARAAVLLPLAQAVWALPLPPGEEEQRCWQRYTRERTQVNLREPTAVDFSNLRDGDTVRSPLLVEFAVRGMGVEPAGMPVTGTGHHHILIDKPLPLNVQSPIPFDDQHRHFGKGQTSTVIDLKPGPHTLRLLFADHEHRPYFVYSKQITVQVAGPRAGATLPKIDPARPEATCPAWYQEERSRPRPADEPLYISNVRAGEALTSPFNLRLGVLALGVCARGHCPEKNGHFSLEVLEAGSRRGVQAHDLVKGTTQINLFVPNGEYVLRLRLLDDRGQNMLPPHELPVKVTGQQAL